MAAPIRKNLILFISKQASLSTNGGFRISPATASLSLSLHFFSTQTPADPDVVNPTVYDILVHRHDFPRQFASRVASELSNMKNPERADSILKFLKSSGFSNPQLQKVLKCKPGILCSSLEGNIEPKIKGFREEGFSSGDIAAVISRCPTIMGLSLNENIIPSLAQLRGLLGSTAAVVGVVKAFPRLLNYNVETSVVPNVELLKGYGLSTDRIRVMLCYHPLALCLNPLVIRASVDKAGQMGLSVASKAFAYAVPVIASLSNANWELKLQAFRDIGFSEGDISTMFRKEPRVFFVSTEKVKKIAEGLVGTGKFDLSSIVECPRSLMSSYEKRYEPRLRILQDRNIIEDWPTLCTLYHLTDAKFYERFVSPYLDRLGDDVCIPKLR